MKQNPVIQRLIGAVVLISLAVIFIPMFLGGEGELASIIHQSNIPPEPAYEFKTFAEPDRQGVQEEVAQATAVEIVEADVDVHEETVETAEPASKTKVTASAPKTSTAKAEEPKPDQVARSEKAAATVNKLVENREQLVKPPQPAPHVQGWSVQVASFTEKSRALSLRDQLRSKKYVAYVESVKVTGTTAYRVRVGPEKDRADAQSLQARLKKQMELDGIVVQH